MFALSMLSLGSTFGAEEDAEYGRNACEGAGVGARDGYDPLQYVGWECWPPWYACCCCCCCEVA